ncbi:MAG TPA: regulatory protein RecX, partial [Candidatus Dormibacteraeota bacterium]|nr:regulatory protein RecX [Candidatus Dormibacteraeota bacterium]
MRPVRRGESIAERRQRRAAVDDPQVVLDAALRFLEARSRSVAEVRRRLVGAGYRSALVDGAVERLLALGMLDDAAFARAWVESRDRARPRGEHALRQELRLKGIDASTIDAVLEDRRGDDDAEAQVDERAAERLMERHRRALERLDDPRVRRQRAYAILARHGFDPSAARDVARRIAAELG